MSKEGVFRKGLRLFNCFDDEYGGLEILVRHVLFKEMLEDITGHLANKVCYVRECDYYKYWFNVSCG